MMDKREKKYQEIMNSRIANSQPIGKSEVFDSMEQAGYTGEEIMSAYSSKKEPDHKYELLDAFNLILIKNFSHKYNMSESGGEEFTNNANNAIESLFKLFSLTHEKLNENNDG